MFDLLFWSFWLSLGINISMFLMAFLLKTDKLTDISYAITFVSLASFAFMGSTKSTFNTALLLMVGIWSIRIGGFLLYRVFKRGRDKRFDGIRDNFGKFGTFWIGQSVTVWVVMSPVLLASTSTIQNNRFWVVGFVIWLTGLCLESVADLQKYRFTQLNTNKNHWIDTGLWRYSRHPNYFGEILVWVGMYIFVVDSLSVAQAVVGMLSPVFIYVLLLFVSGVPVLEKEADKRWGTDRGYYDYRRRTRLLVPIPKRA